MNRCLPVPLWQIEKKKRGQEEEEEGVVPHVQSHSIPSMSNCEVAELTWENGHLSMHGLVAPKNPDPNGTLESIVHRVSNHYPDDVAAWFSDYPHKVSGRNPAEIVPGTTSGSEPVKAGTWPEYGLPPPSSEEPAGAKTNQSVSGSATFGREADTTLMTWASFESPASMRTNGTDKADCTSKCKRRSEADADEDWGCLRGSKRSSEEGDNKGRSGRSLASSSKRGRAAAVHNQSERKRRDRINQRMKALQKLVPNSSKTDKASMLDEVIEYLKQLQAQLQIMNLRNMPHMMMPMGLPQQLQMAYMARMGMGMGLGMGMGMMDMNTVGHVASPTIPPFIHPGTAAPFVPPHLVAPPLMPTGATTRGANLDPTPTPSTSMADPYSTFLAQSMNMELYHKMASLYQQMQQPGHANPPTRVNANMKE